MQGDGTLLQAPGGILQCCAGAVGLSVAGPWQTAGSVSVAAQWLYREARLVCGWSLAGQWLNASGSMPVADSIAVTYK